MHEVHRPTSTLELVEGYPEPASLPAIAKSTCIATAYASRPGEEVTASQLQLFLLPAGPDARHTFSP